MLKVALIDDEASDLLHVIVNLVSLDPHAVQIEILPILLSRDTEVSVGLKSAKRQQNLGAVLATKGILDFKFPELKILGTLDLREETERTRILSFLAEHKVDVIISDSWMGDERAGIRLLEAALYEPQWSNQNWQGWVMTKFNKIADTINDPDFRWRGQFDPKKNFLAKDEIITSANTGICNAELKQVIDIAVKQKEAAPKFAGAKNLGKLIGQSPLMNGSLGIYARIEALARSANATVLITGESGTGKELVAQEIHERSGKSGAFVDINCGEFSKELIGSVLFGHEKGAFTDARERKIGLIESARKGTLFLDEIGVLPLDLQPNLLRVLQERSFRRLGGTERINVGDIRIISATSRNLAAKVEEGLFLRDLLYRLNAGNIHLPPLRDRMEDVPLLTKHFVKIFNHRYSVNLSIAEEAIEVLQARDWEANNVRELSNCIEQAFTSPRVHPESNQISKDDIANSIQLLGQLGIASISSTFQRREPLSSSITLDECVDKEASEIWQFILSGKLVKTLPQLQKKLGDIKTVQIADLADSWARETYNLDHPPHRECKKLFGMTNNAYKTRVWSYRKKLNQS